MIFLVYDTETTGLPLHPHSNMDKQPRIIEFGAALVDEDGEVQHEYNVLINPEEPLDEKITKITGLTDEDLLDQPTFPAAAREIRKLFAKADVLVAHNLPFDAYLVELELLRHDMDDWPWPRYNLCTVQEHVDEWGRRPRLIELYEDTFGEPLAQTHRALDDVHALVAICQHKGIFHEYAEATQG